MELITSIDFRQILYILIASTFTIWYLQFLWSRRRLYSYASKVKGPLALPVIGVLYKLLFSHDILKILCKFADDYPYGIYRIWIAHKLKYVISKPEYIDIVYSSTHATDRDDSYRGFAFAMMSGIFVLQGAEWKESRKAYNSYLNQNRLELYIQYARKNTLATAMKIKDKVKKGMTIDVDAEMTSCSLDSIFNIIFGEERPPELTEDFNSNIIERILCGIWPRSHLVHLQHDGIYRMSKYGKETARLRDFYHRMLEKVIDNRLKEIGGDLYEPSEEIEQSTLMDHLMDKFWYRGVDKMRSKIRDEFLNFLVAGSDTVSTASCYVLMVLGIYPDVQQKVYEEIMDVLGDSNDFDLKMLNQLKYLDRVLKEILRIFPVIPLIAREPETDIDLKDGTIIPKGAAVVMNIFYLHRYEKLWPDPLKFDPDRFLPENVEKRHRNAYMAFSHGPRNCVGMTYGMMGLKAVTINMLRNFVSTTDYKSILEPDLRGQILLRPQQGFKIHLALRNK